MPTPSAIPATLTPMPLSAISTDDGALVVAWALSLPPQAVWAVFDDPALLSQWLGQPVECDVRPGGRLVVDHGEGYLSRSAVTEAKAPHRLAMTWAFPGEPESQIDIDLRPSGGATVMELAHHGLNDLIGSYCPGWITHLTFLEAAVVGVPLPMASFWQLHATFASLYIGRANGSTPMRRSAGWRRLPRESAAMDVRLIDPRDETWEIERPRFRVYFWTGRRPKSTNWSEPMCMELSSGQKTSAGTGRTPSTPALTLKALV